MPASNASEHLNSCLLELLGGDPFGHVYEACESHRDAHGPECGVYPAAPQKMKVLSTLVKALGARRGLEIGGGIGYSALWLADAMGPDGRLETIDRHEQHVELITRYAAQFDLAGRIVAIHGEAIDALQRVSGPYDIIHDDGWFGAQPEYYEREIELLRPSGLLILANCFLLEDAITGEPRADWSQSAGPDWAQHMLEYAQTLASDERLDVSFLFGPAWVGLAYKRPDA